MPPSSPSSGAFVPPPWVFPSPPPSAFSSADGARVVGMRIGATAHSVYRAPGLSTSSGARFCGSSGANERYLNGVGRKSACSVDCDAELGDFVRTRRNGLSRIYLTPSLNHDVSCIHPKTKQMHVTHIIIPNHETLPRDESAASKGATTSARLIPGDTDIDTMFERWTLSLTTGIDWAFTSVGGTCAPEGRASRTRCRCRISIAVRRARRPSVRSNDGDDDAEGGDVVNTRAAAA